MAKKQLVKKMLTGYISKDTVMLDNVSIEAEGEADADCVIYLDGVFKRKPSKNEEVFWHPNDLPVRKIKVILIIEEIA
jgi:hypothetical protein